MSGETLGRYRLKRTLGSGTSGTVVLATDDMGSEYALKLFHDSAPTSEARSRTERPRVDHENIVRTYETGTMLRSGRLTPYAVMEYVEGDTLKSLLQERGTLGEAECLHVLREVASGLCELHQAGALHLDIKPENLIWTRSGRVKLLDVVAPRSAKADSNFGPPRTTPNYAAPETRTHDGPPPDGRSDLYSLGITIYELFTGSLPFDRSAAPRPALSRATLEVPTLGTDTPPHSGDFRSLLAALTARERESRISSAAALLRRLDGDPLPIGYAPDEAVLSGRDEELSLLLERVGTALAGSATGICIVGEAGIGKSTLIDAALRAARGQAPEAAQIVVRYSPATNQSTVGAFLGALARYFPEGVSVTALRDMGCQDRTALPTFANLLSGTDVGEGEEPLTPDMRATLVSDVLSAAASRRGLILIVEDAHFAPAGTWPYLERLRRALVARRALLVVTTRPGAEPEAHEQFEHVVLGRMGEPAVRQYLRSTLGPGPAAETLCGPLTRMTGGLPLLLDATLRELKSSGQLVQQPGLQWTLTSEGVDLALPPSLVAITHRRLDRLEHGARDYIDVAACCDFQFDPMLIESALSLHKIAAEAILRSLWQEHGLVRRVEGRWEFSHHLLYEYVASRVPAPVARTYHTAIADALEHLAGPHDRNDDQLIRICEHRVHSTDPARARPLLMPALAALEASVLPRRAIELGLEALRLDVPARGLDRIRVMIDAGRHMWALHRVREARALHLRAAREARRLGSTRLECRAWSGLIAHYEDVGAAYQARRAAERCGQLALKCEDDAFCGEVLGNIASTMRARGQYAEARRWADEALVRSAKVGYTRGLVRAVAECALIDFARGHIREALEGMRRARDMASEHRMVVGYVRHTGELAQILTGIGQVDEALTVSGEGRELVERHGYTRASIHFDRMDAVLFGLAGRWDAMLAALLHGSATADRHLDDRMRTWMNLSHAALDYARGRSASALARLDNTIEFFVRSRELPPLADAYAARAEINEMLRRDAAALSDVRAARYTMRAAPNLSVQARCAWIRAAVLCSRGRRRTAARLLAQATEDLAASGGWPELRLGLLERRARLHVEDGRLEAAADLWDLTRTGDRIPVGMPHRLIPLQILAAHARPDTLSRAKTAFAAFADRLEVPTRLRCLEQLHTLTQSDTYSEAAQSLHKHVRDHAPTEDRAALK